MITYNGNHGTETAPADILHICVGCSEEQLAGIDSAARTTLLKSIERVAEYVPTFFVLRSDEQLASELVPLAQTTSILRTKSTLVMMSDAHALIGAKGIGRGHTVLLSGVKMAKEVFAVAADLMDFRHCKVIVVRDAVADSHSYTEVSALAMLHHAYPDRFSEVSIDQYQAFAVTAEIEESVYSMATFQSGTDSLRNAANANRSFGEDALTASA